MANPIGGILDPGYTGTGWPWVYLPVPEYSLLGEDYPGRGGDASRFLHPNAVTITSASGSWRPYRASTDITNHSGVLNEGPGFQSDYNRNFQWFRVGPWLHRLGYGWVTSFPGEDPRFVPVGLPDGMRGNRWWLPFSRDNYAVQMQLQTPAVYYLPDQPARNPAWAQWGDPKWSNFPSGYWWSDRSPTSEQLQAAYDNDLAGRFRLHFRQNVNVSGSIPIPTGLFNYLLTPAHHQVELSGRTLTVTLDTPYPQTWGTSPGVVRLTVEADGAQIHAGNIPITPYDPDSILEGVGPPKIVLSVVLSGTVLGIAFTDPQDYTGEAEPLYKAEVRLPPVFGTKGLGHNTFLGVEMSHYASITPSGRNYSPWSYDWGQVIPAPPRPEPPLHQIHRNDGLNGGGQWQLAPNVAGAGSPLFPGWNTGGPIWQISGYN